MKPQLLFSADDPQLVRILQQSFDGCPELTAVVLEPHQLPNLKGVDALYLSMIAAERWNPRPIFYESQVLKTRPEDIGWPPYVVAGILMRPDDPRAGDPTEELKLVMKAVLGAISSYNQANNAPICRVGFWSDTLGIDHIDVAAAGEIIKSAYEEHYS